MMVRGMTPKKKKKILSVPLPPEERSSFSSSTLGWGGEESRMVVAKREGEGRLLSLFRFSRFLLFPNGKKGGGELSREAGDRRRMLCFFSVFRRVTVC